MKSLLGIALLIFVGVVGWRIGGELSPDALGMAVGILFGVMAGIPTALILLASQRRDRGEHESRHRQPQISVEAQPSAQVINNHYHYHAAPGPQRDRQAEVIQRHLTEPMSEPRRFRIIGEIDRSMEGHK
ncbi:MAG: hypothetical protein KDE47_12670 [Caldilineaceae bacterium]|nr:hypothetical protein [Caldilineaceae bacterium]MCB0094059.1 hypothetical protein [Caldilineaceae bacterium]